MQISVDDNNKHHRKEKIMWVQKSLATCCFPFTVQRKHSLICREMN